MKKGFYFAFSLVTLMGMNACSLVEHLDSNRTLSSTHSEVPVSAPAPEPESEPEPEPVDISSAISTESFISRAQLEESNGELQRALYFLKVAAAIDPENAEIKGRVEHMQIIIRSKSEASFQRGLGHYERGETESAKREWLAALRTNPGHDRALTLLKEKLSPADAIAYKLKTGDTPEKISQNVYQTPRGERVVAYFYDFKSPQGPAPGDVIQLPVLGAELIKPVQKTPDPVMNVEAEVAKAEKLLAEKRYDEVLAIAEEIMDYDYLNHEAAGLVNAVYYDKGFLQYKQENYPAALQEFERIDPQYRDTAEKVSEIKSILARQAEEHYLKGVKFFINEDLENAIKEWEVTLALDPDHGKAEADIKAARNLLEKLGDVEQPVVD